LLLATSATLPSRNGPVRGQRDPQGSRLSRCTGPCAPLMAAPFGISLNHRHSTPDRSPRTRARRPLPECTFARHARKVPLSRRTRDIGRYTLRSGRIRPRLRADSPLPLARQAALLRLDQRGWPFRPGRRARFLILDQRARHLSERAQLLHSGEQGLLNMYVIIDRSVAHGPP
jgi:hypothetical protein